MPRDLKSPLPFCVVLSFGNDLGFFLKQRDPEKPAIRILAHKTSVKDIIEACGVPHPEVDLIICNGRPVDFSFQLETDAHLDVHAVSRESIPAFRLQERNVHTFVADGHLGKLVRELRLLGLDVSYRHDADDQDLLATMIQEDRALLTRDRPLLMHREVKNGYYPRSQDPLQQIVEVIRRFELDQKIAPFTRCLRCNGSLAAVSKESVISQLEPLTRLYYNDFQKCSQCNRAYWRGSHLDKLHRQLELIMARLRERSVEEWKIGRMEDWAMREGQR
jgi:uncharacterized protein with PIN domain